MLINLEENESAYLEKLLSYDLGASTTYEEIILYEKLINAKKAENLTISSALDNLVVIVKAKCSVSNVILDFLNCLIDEHSIDLSEFRRLDAQNFASAQLLLSAIRGEQRFMIRNYLKKLKKQGEL
jgi:hypothetical protein